MNSLHLVFYAILAIFVLASSCMIISNMDVPLTEHESSFADIVGDEGFSNVLPIVGIGLCFALLAGLMVWVKGH